MSKDDKKPKERKSKVTYQPPQRMEIPQSVVDRFAAQGQSLYWLRARVGNEEDSQHMAKKKREGFVIVKPEEVQDLIEFLGLIVPPGAEMVLNGANALAKISLEMRQARREYYDQQAINNEKGATRDLERDTRGIRVYNDSRSRTTMGTGRQVDIEE